MKYKIDRIALSALLCAFGASGFYAQSTDEVIRVKTELVVVDAQVLDKKSGQPIENLSRDNFAVYEDGVKQDIAFVSRDKMPLSIVLLFDLTESVQPVLKPLGQGALEALSHLKPDDEVAVMTYAATAQVVQDFTTDHKLIADAIMRASTMTSNDAAYFNEGVFQASAQMRKATELNNRPVIIWLTDNVPNVPSSELKGRGSDGTVALHTEKEAFDELFESGAVVTSLLEKSALSRVAAALYTENPLFASRRKHHPPGNAFKYAEQTGGEVMGSNKDEVSQKLAVLIDHLRTRYTISYHPSSEKPAGTFCRVKLEVASQTDSSKIAIRTRAGYIRGVERRGK
jgi:VWFA-related protein